MHHVVILGPGGAGKTTFARRLSAATGLPHVELDPLFWGEGLVPKSPDEWADLQGELVGGDRWILDGDLGPYDCLQVRLARADTAVILDFPRWRCILRSLRRSPERLDYWKWVWCWRGTYLPLLLEAIQSAPSRPDLRIARSAQELAAVECSLTGST